LLQQNHPVLNWGFRLAHVVLLKMVVVVAAAAAVIFVTDILNYEANSKKFGK